MACVQVAGSTKALENCPRPSQPHSLEPQPQSIHINYIDIKSFRTQSESLSAQTQASAPILHKGERGLGVITASCRYIKRPSSESKPTRGLGSISEDSTDLLVGLFLPQQYIPFRSSTLRLLDTGAPCPPRKRWNLAGILQMVTTDTQIVCDQTEQITYIPMIVYILGSAKVRVDVPAACFLAEIIWWGAEHRHWMLRSHWCRSRWIRPESDLWTESTPTLLNPTIWAHFPEDEVRNLLRLVRYLT